MQRRFVVAAFAIIAILMTTVVLALIQSTKQIPSSGAVYAFKVGVFDDSGCTIETTSITFDAVNPGGTDTHTVYVANNGTSLDMMLNMTTDTWLSNPSNSTGPNLNITLTWDREGAVLTYGQSVPAILTLSVEDNEINQDGLTFSVNINIIGTNSTFPP